MKTAQRLVLLLLLLALASGCSKPRSIGELYEVTVLVDDADWQEVGPQLEELFSATWVTPEEEARIRMVRADPGRPQEALNRRNLLIVSAGPASGPVGQLLESMLKPEVRDRIAKEEGFLFARDEAFARDQKLAILAAPDPVSFRRQCGERSGEILDLFEANDQAAQLERLYRSMEQTVLEDSLRTSWGFTFRVPVDWFLIQQEEEPRMVRLRRLYPDRWLTVHWVAGDDSLRLSEEGMREVRRRLGRAYYDKDYTEPSVGRFGVSSLGQRSTTLLEGFWGTDDYIGGGPFLLWAWFDPKAGPAGRTYYIDAAVLHPAGGKGPFLHQLRTIAGTFLGNRDELAAGFSEP
ncbi:MAG: DUF4837 family protein [Calditrichaeota bacterium]|nr:DUF4837 family protein [Candidatus Cloacimonadota bacterium]MCA9787974.1 DUF4837 family protein [Candidatus Cloacimonadota bacterium]MCB1046913.1 DUF4837 family protein [Calditrichota bacterium]MCB9474085.1 DUF4837 family protein [Candidatus Delongbacteria bacterium]